MSIIIGHVNQSVLGLADVRSLAPVSGNELLVINLIVFYLINCLGQSFFQ